MGKMAARKEKSCGGSAQPFEKAQNGQGNPRKSKPFPLIDFDRLGWILLDLAQFGAGLDLRPPHSFLCLARNALAQPAFVSCRPRAIASASASTGWVMTEPEAT